MGKKRELWVDNVKVIACVLVVLGHFFQSMTKADIIPETALYGWFNSTIYYFHVPLFFICSGYLYQRYSHVHSFREWTNSVGKKLIALGIPYVIFSCATWALKTFFASSVNDKIGSLPYILFKQPASPYWYLYILFVLFAITITAKNKTEVYVLLAISLLLKGMRVFHLFDSGIYFIDKTMDSWIWFVLGMVLTFGIINGMTAKKGIVVGISFFALSVIYYFYIGEVSLLSFILGLMACYSVISIVSGLLNNNSNSIFKFLGKYTMPIFLMHTLFAAPLRSVLLKISVRNAAVHIVVGLIISFVGPILAMTIMEKLKPLDFAIYPGRYLRKKKEI